MNLSGSASSGLFSKTTFDSLSVLSERDSKEKNLMAKDSLDNKRIRIAPLVAMICFLLPIGVPLISCQSVDTSPDILRSAYERLTV